MPVADAATLDWVLSFGCYTNPHPWWISAYIISIICTLCNMTLLVGNIHYLFCQQDSVSGADLFIKKQANKLFYLSIVILYTIGPAMYLFVDTLSLTCSLSVYWFVFIKGTGLNIMLLATEMLYLFYVFRIKRIFKDIPSLKLHNCQLYFFYFGFVAQLTSHCISYRYYLSAWNDMTKVIYQEGALLFQVISLGLYIVFVIVVLSTFYYKVHRLLHQIKQKKSKKATGFVVRYLLLASIALLTTTILSLVSAIRSRIGLTSIAVIQMKNICLTVDTVVNVTCLYLQFPFADALYMKMCCCCVRWLDRRDPNKNRRDNTYKSGDTGFTVETGTLDSELELEALSEKQGTSERERDQGRTVDSTQTDDIVFTQLSQENTV